MRREFLIVMKHIRCDRGKPMPGESIYQSNLSQNSISNLHQTTTSLASFAQPAPAANSVPSLSQAEFTQLLLQALEAALTSEISNVYSQPTGLANTATGNTSSTGLPSGLSSSQWLAMNLANGFGVSGPLLDSSLLAGGSSMAGQAAASGAFAPSGSNTQLSSLINQASARYGVPSSLIASVIQQESGFQSGAVSSAGAVGLMQLMPSTWQSYQVTNPYDPAQNIDAGTHYLSDLLHQFNGNVSLALAAYNAGPATVSHYGGIPPYPETQHYVTQILNRLNPSPS